MIYRVLKHKHEEKYGRISEERDELTKTDYPDLYSKLTTMSSLKHKHKYCCWLFFLDDYELIEVELKKLKP